jgi:hypothetical protein
MCTRVLLWGRVGRVFKGSRFVGLRLLALVAYIGLYKESFTFCPALMTWNRNSVSIAGRGVG